MTGGRKLLDLTGQRFGRLVVIDIAVPPARGQATIWRCRCDCGEESRVRVDDLRSGHITSCGCSKVQNLTGRVFGRLLVLGRAKNSVDRFVQWLCKCSCGELHIVKGHCLRQGHTRSCGCLRVEVARRTAATRRRVA